MTDTPKQCEAAVYPPYNGLRRQCLKAASVFTDKHAACAQHAKSENAIYPKEYRHDD